MLNRKVEELDCTEVLCSRDASVVMVVGCTALGCGGQVTVDSQFSKGGDYRGSFLHPTNV